MTDYDVAPPPDRLSERVQLRHAFSTEKGDVTQFMTQLEFWLDGEWREVIRYDHNPELEAGHDVTEEGLHRDIYREGTKHDTEQVTGPIPANAGFNNAEEDLRENVERYTKRFKQWHGVSDTTNP